MFLDSPHKKIAYYPISFFYVYIFILLMIFDGENYEVLTAYWITTKILIS